MGSRINGKRGAASPRRSGLSGRIGMGAMLCAAFGASVFAQSQSDFLDPLEEERSRIERQGEGAAPVRSATPRAEPAAADEPASADLLSRARDGAASGAAAAQERATGIWARMRAAVSEVAERLGLPTAGLLGLLGLALAGLAALVGWTLFRGRRGKGVDAASTAGADLYAKSSKGRVRRLPGDANPLAVKADPEGTKAGAFEETMPENFDDIFRDEEAATAPPAVVKTVEPTDPATWKKPNLDKLRDSIKADWMPSKGGAATGAVAAAGAAGLAFANRPDTGQDPASQSLSEVSDGWEDWDAQVKPDEDVWGETLYPGDDDGDGDAALNRIRALRESLRAS